LSLCKKAGLVGFGVIAIDGRRSRQTRRWMRTRAMSGSCAAILAEAQETGRQSASLRLSGSSRLTAGLRRPKEAPDAEDRVVVFDLDRERLVNSEQGRRRWQRVARRQADEQRYQQARPIAGARPARLRESRRRLEEDHRAEWWRHR
jgi:hypothetical protein